MSAESQSLLSGTELKTPSGRISAHAQMLLLNFALASAARKSGDEYAEVTGELKDYIAELESRRDRKVSPPEAFGALLRTYEARLYDCAQTKMSISPGFEKRIERMQALEDAARLALEEYVERLEESRRKDFENYQYSMGIINEELSRLRSTSLTPEEAHDVLDTIGSLAVSHPHFRIASKEIVDKLRLSLRSTESGVPKKEV